MPRPSHPSTSATWAGSRSCEPLPTSPVCPAPKLVRQTGLARSTVVLVRCDMVAPGLVRRSANADATGARQGRPPKLFSLEPDDAHALGLDEGHDHVRAILMGFVRIPRWNQSEARTDDARWNCWKTKHRVAS
jgi:hypothetical protein